MSNHGVQSLGGPLLKTEMLLNALMKKFYGPAEPVPRHHLACRGPQILAGKILAATIRSVPLCGTPQLDLADRAPGARGVADANVHALPFVPTRRQTHGVPLEPAMTTEKRVDVPPLPGGRGGQRARCRCDAAGFTQGHKEVPALVSDGLLALCLVVAALGSHQHFTPLVGANRVLQVERAHVLHHVCMVAVRGESMRLTLALAIEGNRPQRHQHVTQKQDDSGPLMTDAIPLAVMQCCGVFRGETGPMLQRTVDQEQDLPGQPVDACERLGTLPGLGLGERRQRGDGSLGMRWPHSREEGLMQSGKSGGFFERMLRGDDHQKEQRAGANPPQPLTDGNPTFPPSLYGASEQRASPGCEHSDMGGSDDSLGKGVWCPSTLGKDGIYDIPGTASL